MVANGRVASERMRSGELARAAGVSVDTLRHYERSGLLPLPPRLANGYRVYPPEALARVRMIQNALAVGFDLNELHRILRARDRGHAPCLEVRAIAARKLEEVGQQIESLEAFRETLRATLDGWDRKLAGQKPGQRAGLLESLSLSVGKEPARSPAWRSPRFDRRRRRKENP